MHATSAQSMADHRTTAKAALAAIIFGAGIVLGAIVGATVLPVTAPASANSLGLDSDAPWFKQYREGERGSNAADVAAPASVDVGLDSDDSWFNLYRDGERGGDAADRGFRDDASHPGDGGP
jgi:hypothetical protein